MPMATVSGLAPVNGTQLHYEVCGQGHPLVLIHGVTLDHRMWESQIASFADAFTILRYDVRGFGKSATPEVTYDHADDLDALLHYLNISSAHVLGLSLGGRIALNFALKHPRRLRRLVAVDAGLEGYVFAGGNPAAAVVAKARESGIDPAKRAWLEHPIFDTTRPHRSAFELVRKMVNSYSGWHWLNKDPHRSEPKAIERLHAIRAPTLVITGEKDTADYHEIKSILCRNISGAKSASIPQAGHLCSMEAPQEFNKLVMTFLEAKP
jgi:3-oxoadipate enol-lactonase